MNAIVKCFFLDAFDLDSFTTIFKSFLINTVGFRIDMHLILFLSFLAFDNANNVCATLYPAFAYKSLLNTNKHKGQFKNYVDKILTVFDYLPTSMSTYFTLNVNKKRSIF